MEVIISAILGIMIGIIITRLKTSNEMANLKYERDLLKRNLKKEILKAEQRDIFIRDLLEKPNNKKISKGEWIWIIKIDMMN